MRGWSRVFGLSALVVVRVMPVHAHAGIPTVRYYVQSVHQLRVRFDYLVGATVPRASEITMLRASMLRLNVVQLPDGRIVHTDLPDLATGLAAPDRVSFLEVGRELDALDNSLTAMSTQSVQAPQLAELDSVLRDSRFQQSLVDRLWKWAGEQALRLASNVAFLTQANPAIKIIVALIFLTLVGGMAFLIARGAAQSFTPDTIGNRERERPATSAAARARAGDQARTGDFRAALRFLFLATLLQLQEQGTLDLSPGLTNREYLGLLRRGTGIGPSREQPLLELVDAFDRAWYGHIPLREEEYRRYEKLAAEAVRGTRAA